MKIAKRSVKNKFKLMSEEKKENAYMEITDFMGSRMEDWVGDDIDGVTPNGLESKEAVNYLFDFHVWVLGRIFGIHLARILHTSERFDSDTDTDKTIRSVMEDLEHRIIKMVEHYRNREEEDCEGCDDE